MNKILSLVIYSILLILVFLFIGSLFKSCTSSDTDFMTDTTDMVSENIESAGETIVAISEGSEEDNLENEFEGGEFQIAEDNDVELTFENTGGSSFELDEEETQEVEQVEEIATPTETQSSNTNYTPSSSNNGSHLIIAGSYREKYNADKMIQKLQNLGFDNAKVVVFDNSNIYAAVAGYFNGSSAAQEAKNSLIRNGIDSYVKRRS